MKHMPRERASPINEFGLDKIIMASFTKKILPKNRISGRKSNKSPQTLEWRLHTLFTIL